LPSEPTTSMCSFSGIPLAIVASSAVQEEPARVGEVPAAG
jgi:hypothetical protein